jgi:uncharacterized protein DUF4019
MTFSSASKLPRLPMRALYGALILLMLSAFSSCGSSKSVGIATRGVEEFHKQLNSEEYQSIYAVSDENLQKATTETDFVSFLQAVHKKLGNVQKTQRSNFQIGMSTGQGTVVTLVYQTTFDQGSGTEQFQWHMRDNQPMLLGYHINSNALVLK